MTKTLDTVAELDAATPGTVIVTGDGHAYQKNRGRWRSWLDKGASSALMLDPDKCGQPLTVVHVPGEPRML